MARRFQEITEVYRQELAALARGDKWTAFLRSACRNYKLHFEEQVLVHAQCPGCHGRSGNGALEPQIRPLGRSGFHRHRRV